MQSQPTAQTIHGKSRLILSDGKIRNLLFSIIGSNFLKLLLEEYYCLVN
jgi:hypothetical protein